MSPQSLLILPKTFLTLTPAQAGVQARSSAGAKRSGWIPACAGMTAYLGRIDN
jgi:hypothetical protein